MDLLYRQVHLLILAPNHNSINNEPSIGLAIIFKMARKKGQLIYLSGQGGDEIYSDYGHNGVKYRTSSTFGGKFPDDLSSIFPWKNFYGSCQRAFIDKEECISGGYGIEGRYPLLDRSLVQEFLWLTPALKNMFYKAPIHAYLAKHGYPFKLNEKIGFKIIQK